MLIKKNKCVIIKNNKREFTLALYSKTSQNTVKEKPQPTKVVGIVLSCLSMFLLLSLTLSFPKFLSAFLLGIFGLSSYAILTLLLIIGTSLIFNKQIITNKRYFVFILLTVFCVLVFMHLLLTSKAMESSNFAQYIASCYSKGKTVGGVVLGTISFGFYSLFKTVGSCIILAILVVVFVGLSVDSFINNSITMSKSKKIKHKIIENEGVKSPLVKPITKPMFSENKTDEKTTIINTEGTNSVVENTVYQKSANEERRRYILTPPNMEDIYNFSKKTNRRADASTNYIANTTLPARPSKNPFTNEDSLKRSREFLESTYPTLTKNKQPVPEPAFQNSFEQNVTMQENPTESNTLAQHDFVNVKLEELKQSIHLDNKPVIPASNSRASLLNSVSNINKLPTEEQDTEDFGSIHEVDKSIVQPEQTTNFQSWSATPKYENEVTQTNNLKNPIQQFEENKNFNISNSYESIVKKRKREYIRPPIDLLNTISSSYSNDDYDVQTNVAILEQTLDDFKIPAKVRQVTKGPSVTRYEIQMPAGISVKKVQQHAEDIAMVLSANGKIRIEAPIPGKNAVGIEVPNKEVATIGLRDVIDSENFTKATSPLTIALGKDITGEAKVCDLRKLTHMLVAGTTGSGKSVCLNALIVSMMYKASPEDLRFILVDPKRVEFAIFNGMPHLMLPDVISEPEKALNALNWCIKEMERRYGIIEEARVKNLKEYNETTDVLNGTKPKLPLIVVIVDELADLMMYNKREVEEKILKLAQKSRAAGIHLVLATQRPSVDVITGTIKGNLPSRIAFAVTSFPDSKTILDCGGAERLLGRGDMLYAPQELPEPVRLQGAYISNSEVEAVVEFIKQNNDTDFDEETSKSIVSKQSSRSGFNLDNSDDFDDYFEDALRLVIESGSASGSFIQRRLGIGYNRAGRIMDQMEREGFIAPSDGSNKPRAVLITMEEFERRFNN